MKKILALTLALVLALSLCACGGGNADTTTTDNGDAADTATVEIPPVEDLTGTDTSAIPGVEDGVLTVGMECAYAPYNWTQTDDSNGAVPIVNNPGSYANGYDVMIAKQYLRGQRLGAGDVQAIDWDGLVPAAARRHHRRRHRRPVHDRQTVWSRSTWQAPTSTPPSSASAKKDSDLGQGQGHQRADRRHLHRSDRHHLVRLPVCPRSRAPRSWHASETRSRHDHGCWSPAPWTSSAPTCPPPWAPVATYSDLAILDFSDTEDNFKVDEGADQHRHLRRQGQHRAEGRHGQGPGST